MWNNWMRSTIKSDFHSLSLSFSRYNAWVCLRVYEVGLWVICLIAYNNNNNTLTSFNCFFLYSRSHSVSFKMAIAEWCAPHIRPNLHSKLFGFGTFWLQLFLLSLSLFQIESKFFSPSFVDFFLPSYYYYYATFLVFILSFNKEFFWSFVNRTPNHFGSLTTSFPVQRPK